MSGLEESLSGLEQFFALQVPLRVALDGDGSVDAALRAVMNELAIVESQSNLCAFPRSSHAGTARPGHPAAHRDPAAGRTRGRRGQRPDDRGVARRMHQSVDLSDGGLRSCSDSRAPARLHRIPAAPDRASRRTSRGGPAPTDAERERLLVTWNATHKAYPDDASVHELFEQQVKRTPDAVALVCEDQQRSYDELNRAANQLARHLQELGRGPEVLVGICLERSIDLLTGVYGILKAGAAYVPLDPAYPADRLALMVEDARCPILADAAEPAPPAASSSREDRLHRHGLGGASSGSRRTIWTRRTGRNLSYVIYTSGSTGTAQGRDGGAPQRDELLRGNGRSCPARLHRGPGWR